jgi:hypothetical protein
MSTLGGQICTFEEDLDHSHVMREPLEANMTAWDSINLFLEEEPSLWGYFHCACGWTTLLYWCVRFLSYNFDLIQLNLRNHMRNYYFIVKEVLHLLYKGMHLFIFTHGWIIWSSLFWRLINISFFGAFMVQGFFLCGGMLLMTEAFSTWFYLVHEDLWWKFSSFLLSLQDQSIEEFTLEERV